MEVRFLCLLLLRVESSNTICVWASQGVSPRSHDGQSQGEDNQFLDIDGADDMEGPTISPIWRVPALWELSEECF